MLSGRRSLVQIKVLEGGTVIELTRDRLLELVQSDGELSEIIMRAFILRRVELIARGFGDAVLLGSAHSPGTLRIKEFLTRNNHPYAYIDLDRDTGAQEFLDRFSVSAVDVPVVICRGQDVLRNPTNAELAACLGFNETIDQTQLRDVVVIGAGPAGLMLGHLLHLAGIDSFIIENRSEEYVIDRVRAGVLEQSTVDLMVENGVGDRLQREGMSHDGIYINVFGKRHRIDFAELIGRRITVYGQNEVVKDLIAARHKSGRPLRFNVADVSVHDLESNQPKIRFTEDDESHEIRCDFIAGCDGFHGICRPSIPASSIHIYERVYPFGWLGILATAPPSSPELVYSRHERGFALFSMRSNSVTRLYLQCAPDEDLAKWSDDRIWDELLTRLRS